MAFRPLPARAPSVFLRDARSLKAIFNHAQRLAHLQRLLESQLQPAAREHCHVASWREGTLVLVVTDGHWATRLRYQQKRLQRQLVAFKEFANLTRLSLKVQPSITRGALPVAARDLSPVAAEALNEAAEGISDPKLRAALERLAAHGKPRKSSD